MIEGAVRKRNGKDQISKELDSKQWKKEKRGSS